MNRYLTRTEFVAALRKMADHIEKKEVLIEPIYFPNGSICANLEEGYVRIKMNENVELKMGIFKRDREETMADIKEESEKHMDKVMESWKRM